MRSPAALPPRKRGERVPPKWPAPAARWRLRRWLRAKAAVRNRTPSPTPLARRHASMAVVSTSSSGPRSVRAAPVPLDVAPAVTTPTAKPEVPEPVVSTPLETTVVLRMTAWVLSLLRESSAQPSQ